MEFLDLNYFLIQWSGYSQAVLPAQEPAASPASYDDSERFAAGEPLVELHHSADSRTQTYPFGKLGLQNVGKPALISLYGENYRFLIKSCFKFCSKAV